MKTLINSRLVFYISIKFFFVALLFILAYSSTKMCSFPYLYRLNGSTIDMKPKVPSDKYAFVSCFFPIKEGPIIHTIDEYKTSFSRLANYFNKNLSLFIFTNDEGKKILQNSRFSNDQSISLTSNIKFITKYQNIFDAPKISEYKTQYESIAKEVQADSSTNISAEIGAINNAKFAFLQDIIEIYTKDLKLVFWIDIDLIKTDDIASLIDPLSWPSPERIDKIFTFETDEVFTENGLTEKVLLWGAAKSFQRVSSADEANLEDYEGLVNSGFFGGTKEKVTYLIEHFWSIHNTLADKKKNVLRDDLLLGVFMSLNKNDVFLFDMNWQKCNKLVSCVGYLYKSNVCEYNNQLHRLFAQMILVKNQD